ncbi:hypothetical protein [Flavobacterium microcysteis]|uniref:Fibronectin type-III domain-containing protein n=1 Tax=Flavobacterium microcysteis TaxID=2596891 RepID=A0A501Q1M0_9FLAO|nr:hypothetical protein [Flavobacterium microcysteis]TPD66067.1 hypothetical protein FJA49_18005 [Flavobacterium microcysteis]
MKTKITAFTMLFLFVLLMGCSGGDDGGSSCGKVESVTFSTTPAAVTLYFTGGNNANSFKVEYGPSGFTQGTGTSVVTSNTQVEITELIPSTTYDFYITGICSASESSAPYKLSSVTTQASQCTGTTSVQFGQLAPDQIDLQFTYSGGYAEYYEVEYGTAGFTLGTGTKTTTSFGTSSKNLTGIQASTTYDFYVRSSCVSGEKTPYVKFTYTTMNGCPKPFNLSSWIVSGSCNSGTATRAFSWSYLSGTPQSYTISIVQDATDNPAAGNTFETSTTGISISNMFCNWRVFYVKANCTGNDSSEWAGPYYF